MARPKRKASIPVRYQEYDLGTPFATVTSAPPRATSTPQQVSVEDFFEQRFQEITRDLTELQLDLAHIHSGGGAPGITRPANPPPNHVSRLSTQPLSRDKQRDLGGHLACVPESKQTKETAGRETSQHITASTQHQQAGKTTYDNSYPTLQELRAMNLLDAPKNAAGLPAQAPWPADNRAAPLPKVQFNNEETPSQGKTTKLVSGLTRKVHDKVKREVLWPHEFVFSSTGTVTPDNITWDQLVAGELAIIFGTDASQIERDNRGVILQNLMLDISTFTFEGVRFFYKIMLTQAEKALFDLEDQDIYPSLYKLKQKYLKKPDIKPPTGSFTTSSGSLSSNGSWKKDRYSSDYTCPKYQGGFCTLPDNHAGLAHKCKFCTRYRPEVPLNHPAKDCPYNDRATRLQYQAGKPTNNA